MSIQMGSIPQATLNQSGIVYVGRKDVSANTLKHKKIVEINQLYENEHFVTVCFYRQETVREGPCRRY